MRVLKNSALNFASAAGELQLEVQDIEIMLGLLTPRATGAKSAAGLRSAEPADAVRVVALVRSAHEEFKRRNAAGEAIAAAILALAANAWDEKGIADIEAAVSGQRAGE